MKKLICKKRFIHRNEDGAVIIEFAGVLALLVLIIVFTFDFGLLIYQRMVVHHAVRVGAQIALKDPAGHEATVKAVVEAVLVTELPNTTVAVSRFYTCPLDSSELVVDSLKTNCPAGPIPSLYYKINATKAYQPTIPMVSAIFSGTLVSSTLKVQIR